MFVKLSCEEKELRQRLKHPSRKTFKKLDNIKGLQSIRQKYDLNAIVPFGKTQIINNTQLSGRKVAQMIKNHYELA